MKTQRYLLKKYFPTTRFACTRTSVVASISVDATELTIPFLSNRKTAQLHPLFPPKKILP